MVPDFMSQAPRPNSLPSLTTGAYGGVSQEFERARRHHVAMPLHDQRFACLGLRTVGTDHRARPGEIVLDRAEAAQILEVVDIDMPVVDLVAARAQEVADRVLARPSRATGRGMATKSRVVASWASKPASTASRILCCVSAFMRARSPVGMSQSRAS